MESNEKKAQTALPQAALPQAALPQAALPQLESNLFLLRVWLTRLEGSEAQAEAHTLRGKVQHVLGAAGGSFEDWSGMRDLIISLLEAEGSKVERRDRESRQPNLEP